VATDKEVSGRALERFTGRSLTGLAVIAGGGVGFGVLLMLVRFHWSPLYRADHETAEWFNNLVAPHQALIKVLQVVTDLGGRPIMIWLVAIAAISLFIRRRPRLAVYLLVTGAGALILDPSLKALVGRLRPVVDVPITHAPGNSFPSGHALGSTVVYGALLLVFLPAMSHRWRRPAIGIVTALVVVIGLTRIALGVHFVSDVLAGWALGAAWLGVTAYAFRLWRREQGERTRPISEGLEPEAADEISLAPDGQGRLPHLWLKAAELITGWVLVFGVLYAFGRFVSYHAKGTFFDTLDTDVPKWFEGLRTPVLNEVSWWCSKAGDTHAITIVSLVACPLMLAAWRRWRPVAFVVLAIMGELALFLASAAVVGRPRPKVTHLDGQLPTSSFPSGHIAATICLYTAICVLVMGRTDRWWRWLTVALAVIMPVGVATSRMYRGMHHPTDFMGAIILGALWIGPLYWVLRPGGDRQTGNRPAIGSEQVDEIHDEPAKAAQPG
jgi:membrane-associated phospholipid phosphatase